MSDIPSFGYDLLWKERVLRSVANLTRADGIELLALAAAIPLRTAAQVFPFERAAEAVAAARDGGRATPVLVPV
jgi:propanol-preferring alcohol dehydrogenase